MPAQLVSLTDGLNILLDKPILLIGRHPECDIQIDSRKVSRRHCCIAQIADYLVVRDLGSTNGVRINGVRVLEGRLNDKDELTIGGHRYRVSWDMLPEFPPRPDQGLRMKAEPESALRALASDEDDLLEACDEPVPLTDLRGRRPGAGSPKPEPPRSGAVPPRENQSGDAPLRPCAERPPSLIIPEELNLAPASDPDVQNPRTS